MTGRARENLDESYRQLTVKLAALEFNDDKELGAVVLRLLGQLGVDRDSRVASLAYKLDEAAEWKEWRVEVGLAFSKVTGPQAPRWFRFCALRGLGAANSAETNMPLGSLPGLPALSPDDVVAVFKTQMASPEVWRRLRSPNAFAATAAGHFEDAAFDYLVGWAEGHRRRDPRPDSYAFLRRRWQAAVLVQPPPRTAPQLPQVCGRAGSRARWRRRRRRRTTLSLGHL